MTNNQIMKKHLELNVIGRFAPKGLRVNIPISDG